MERHERICWRNPNRYCEQCGNKGVIVEDYGAPYVEPCYFCSQREPDVLVRAEVGPV